MKICPAQNVGNVLISAANSMFDPLEVNSEGFLAGVFHPWVRWDGPESGFESSPGGAGGV